MNLSEPPEIEHVISNDKHNDISTGDVCGEDDVAFLDKMDIVLDKSEKVQDTLYTFVVSVTAKDLGLELQEDVLGLDDGVYVRAVKNDGPLASSQILRGDQILSVASEDVTHLSKNAVITLLHLFLSGRVHPTTTIWIIIVITFRPEWFIRPIFFFYCIFIFLVIVIIFFIRFVSINACFEQTIH